ncbi:GNAT family N-acetyltransferase [Streptomyces sp. NPDC058665]|uniref:GNAT family N-acetyltransferase n=1 Tax=Streptomyces sp. NPDC058665 TaxID=3346586 RepID=UPI003662839A
MELRELTSDDAPEVQRIYSGRSLRFLGRGPMGADEAAAYVAAATARPRLRFILGIDIEGDLVGAIKLNVTNTEGRVSYILRHDRWGRGFATGAVTELLALAFGALSLSTVRAKHQVENGASGRVLVKAGFTHTGTADGFSQYVAKRTQPGDQRPLNVAVGSRRCPGRVLEPPLPGRRR